MDYDNDETEVLEPIDDSRGTGFDIIISACMIAAMVLLTIGSALIVFLGDAP